MFLNVMMEDAQKVQMDFIMGIAFVIFLTVVTLLNTNKLQLVFMLLLILAVVLLGIRFPTLGNIALSLLLTIICSIIVFCLMFFALSVLDINVEAVSPFLIFFSTILLSLFYLIEPSLSDLPGLNPVILWTECVVGTIIANLLVWVFTNFDLGYSEMYE